MNLYGKHADVAALNERVDAKLIARREHPSMPGITIYNYTAKAQYDRVWDEHILQARGLVVAADGEILARPLPKFFNHDEIESLPWHLPFEVTTKMDGSMFLLRALPDGRRITATRGSFVSEQADGGRELLRALYPQVAYDTAITYVFEFIHPLFRIVVDYGGLRDLVLLAMIDTATGQELPLWKAPEGLHTLELHEFSNIAGASDLLAFEAENVEGFVVRFADGTRAKVKFEEYKRLHRIVTGVSSRTIWEYLRDGRNIAEIVEHVPDELNKFVETWFVRLTNEFSVLKREATVAAERASFLSSRKAQAAELLRGDKRTATVAFRLLDGKPAEELIWKLIEPAYEPPPFAAIDGAA